MNKKIKQAAIKFGAIYRALHWERDHWQEDNLEEEFERIIRDLIDTATRNGLRETYCSTGGVTVIVSYCDDMWEIAIGTKLETIYDNEIPKSMYKVAPSKIAAK